MGKDAQQVTIEMITTGLPKEIVTVDHEAKKVRVSLWLIADRYPEYQIYLDSGFTVTPGDCHMSMGVKPTIEVEEGD